MRSNQEFYLKRITLDSGREHEFMGQFTIETIKNSAVINRNKYNSLFLISEDRENWYAIG